MKKTSKKPAKKSPARKVATKKTTRRAVKPFVPEPGKFRKLAAKEIRPATMQEANIVGLNYDAITTAVTKGLLKRNDAIMAELAKIEGIVRRVEEIVAVVERSEILLTKMDATLNRVLFFQSDPELVMKLGEVEEENIGVRMANYAPELLKDIASVANAFNESKKNAVNTIATAEAKPRKRAVVVGCEHVGCEKPGPHEHEIGGPCMAEATA